MRVTKLSLAKVQPNPDQPRKQFNDADLAELAANIAEHGQLSAILVRPAKGGIYEIVHGERRWRACKIAGLETIKAEIRELTDDEAYTLSVIENEQRENLTAIETAQSLATMMAGQGLTQAQLAKQISKSRDWVAQKLRLLNLPRKLKNPHPKWQTCRIAWPPITQTQE